MKRFLWALLGVTALSLPIATSAARAQSSYATPMDAAAAHDWDQAASLAAQYPDPVAAKIILYYRLLTRGAATAAEIDQFMRTSPDWPQQVPLENRWEQALVQEPDAATALAQCKGRMPLKAPTLLFCAQALAAGGDTDGAAAMARSAWTGSGVTDPDQVASFLGQWASVIRPEDDSARFRSLAGAGAPAAQAELTRLPSADQPAAIAWLALNDRQTDAGTLYAALPAEARRTPGLFLAAARYARIAAGDPQAAAVWAADGDDAFTAALPAQQHAMWVEAARLARNLVGDNQAQQAFTLVDGLAPSAPADHGDQAFLAGFLALRLLHEPGKALAYFQQLSALSGAAITQSRAHYWTGRALAASGSTMQATAEYKAAAAWPTTFYGQLAGLALGDSPGGLNRRILGVPQPVWTTAQAIDFAGREVARAAAFLTAWGQPRRANNFLMDLGPIAPDATDLAMAGQLALGFQIPQAAVGLGRFAGLHGVMLLQAGWPMPVQPPAGAVEPAVALALMRQESSFDVAAASPVGALGLMQLMPATAKLVAGQQGLPYSAAALVTDPGFNMTLGTAYFGGLLQRFDNCLPCAIAGYNAGPHRVDQWLAQNGDFRTPGGPDVLDWIELIPFDETRNYVQRVTEGIEIYRAKEGVALPHPLAAWLH